MALAETGLDFSSENWDTAVPFFDGAWVIAMRHLPGRKAGLELNNRTFVFKIPGESPFLVVFGWGASETVDAVKQLANEQGLPVRWVIGNGGGHHLFLELWYRGFPDARVLVPGARIPSTRNGERMASKYSERWELLEGQAQADFEADVGDLLDLAIFDQLYGPSDAKYAKNFGEDYGKDHSSPIQTLNGFSYVWKLITTIQDVSQRNDEVFMLHKPSGLVIGGHNFQFSFVPHNHSPEPHHELSKGPFPLNWMIGFLLKTGTFKSSMEDNATPIGDPALHAKTWEQVLSWPIKAWTTAHDPPQVCGPDMTGDELKSAIRASLSTTGELDPSGASYKGVVLGA